MNAQQHAYATAIVTQLRDAQRRIDDVQRLLPHPDGMAWIGIATKLEEVIDDVCRAIAENTK